jgi:hypothetical protein
MKKILFVLGIGVLLLSACTGVKTISTGLENESFLEFIGLPSNYSGGVDVNIDDKDSFNAEVNKDHADRPKGKVYAISTGTHIITVSYDSDVIFKKQIFVSSQETKKIILP